MEKSTSIQSVTTYSIQKDVLHYIVAQLIPAIVGFVAVAVYTRLLNPKEYGQYVLVITTVNLVASIFFSWLNQSGMRYYEYYKKQEEIRKLTSTCFISLLLFSVIILIVWYLSILSFKNAMPGFVRLFLLGGLLLPAQVSYTFSLVFIRAERKSFNYAVYCTLHSIGILLVTIWLIQFKKCGSEGILISMIVVTHGLFLFELVKIFKKNLLKTSAFSKKILKNLIRYGVPMVGVATCAFIVSVSDRYLLQYFLNTEYVGIYSAGCALSQRTIAGISQILSFAAVPVIFQTYVQKGKNQTMMLLNKMVRVYLIVLIPACTGIGLLAKEIISVVLGHEFQDAYNILPWLAGGLFFHGLGLYFSVSFQLIEKTVISFWIYVFVAVINIVLNILFIPKSGILGAAYATLIAYLLFFFIAWYSGKKTFDIQFPWQSLFKTVTASFVMAVFLVSALSMSSVTLPALMVKIILGGSIYVITLAMVKESLLINGSKTIVKKIRMLSNSF